MYTVENYRTKKALREAVARGDIVTVYQPGPFGRDPRTYQGVQSLEGPHYPQAHSWYASAEVRDGVVTKVK